MNAAPQNLRARSHYPRLALLGLAAACLLGLPASTPLPAQDAGAPPRRVSPIDRRPGDAAPRSATPTPIAQSAAPSVVLPEATPRNESSAPGAEAPDLSLEVRSEPDGSYVTLAELLRVVRQIDPDVQSRWDGLLGVFRIEAGGHSLQALSNQPVLVVDGRTIPVSKPIRVKAGVALVPLESVNAILGALGIELALVDDGIAPGAVPSAEPTPEPGTVADALSRRRPRPGMLSPEDSLLGDVGRPAMAQLDIPQVGASIAGLTWAELADRAHSRPPSRVTIAYDREMEALARRLGGEVQRVGNLQVSLIDISGRRDDDALLTRIAQTRPDLVLDLIAMPRPAAGAAPAFEIWSVHEALWGSAPRPGAQSAPPLHELYRAHQFHNLALGSMLRTELARGFPAGAVRHELAPSYLLRRVDAPSAGIVVPADFAQGDERELDRVVGAIAGGFAGYYAGVRSAMRL
jgi:hypothetical protein